jgi:hypothetical protein
MKIGPVGAKFLQTERRTDERTDIRRIVDKIRFSQFCKCVETILYEGTVENIE